jgi:hypothetical protein
MVEMAIGIAEAPHNRQPAVLNCLSRRSGALSFWGRR